MDALELLLTRQSCPRLGLPAPTESQLDIILNAGARVPDHGNLSPWEFILVAGEGIDKLSNIFSHAAALKGIEGDALIKVANMPRRAPMMIVVVAKVVEHPKVPTIEQHMAAGCAVMAMQQAAFSQGLGGIWRTGEFAFDSNVHKQLGLIESDQIVGFLYLGTPVTSAPLKPTKQGRQFVRSL